jgi:MFS family permease
MLWVEAAAFPLYALAPSWGWLAGVAFLESVITPIYSVAMDAYRISITPDRMRGRVNSALGTLVTGAMSIGTILGGLLLALAALTTSSRTIRGATAASAEPAAREAATDPQA